MLVCENISLGYGANVIVQNLTFSLHDGDYLCVIGENGSGKTTLIKTLLGLMPPVSGKITLPEGTGYLPQQTDMQKDFPAFVWEVVLSGCLGRLGWRVFYGRKHKAMALEALNSMNILQLKHKSYRELSGGQQQRVLLARALCAAKNTLVLDEPTAGLDQQTSAELYRVIADLNAKGLTIIMITHDIDAAVQNSSHILKLSKGSVFFGTREEFTGHD